MRKEAFAESILINISKMAQSKQQQSHSKMGDQMFAEQPKINSELLSLTYGVFVAKLIREADDHSAD